MAKEKGAHIPPGYRTLKDYAKHLGLCAIPEAIFIASVRDGVLHVARERILASILEAHHDPLRLIVKVDRCLATHAPGGRHFVPYLLSRRGGSMPVDLGQMIQLWAEATHGVKKPSVMTLRPYRDLHRHARRKSETKPSETYLSASGAAGTYSMDPKNVGIDNNDAAARWLQEHA